MFGMMGFGELEEDPIFGQHMRSMSQMSGMMNGMMGGVMFPGMPMLPGMAGGGLFGQAPMPGLMMPMGSSSTTMIQSGFGAAPMLMQSSHQQHGAGAMMPFGGPCPFGMMGGPFGQLNSITMSGGGGGGGGGETVFSSSQVVSMTRGPDGRPQVYKASSSMKKGPNGVRQTQKTVEDSRSGVRKMAVGHHIGDRSHVVERERNYRTGDEEERQDFINLDEDEAEEFQREFQQRSGGMLTGPGAGPGARRAAIMPAEPATTPSAGILPTPTMARSTAQPHSRLIADAPGGAQSDPSKTTRTAAPTVTARRPIRRPVASAPSSTSIHPHPYAGASLSSGGRRRAPKSANQPQQLLQTPRNGDLSEKPL